MAALVLVLRHVRSYERLNARRLQHLAQEADAEDPAADEDADERRHCIKRSFHCKLLSPLLGYGSDFELLQYVYDLHLWTDLGSRRNAANGTAMRLMMRGHPMSPLYWMDIKHGLHDLVRQLGYPHLYWTLAPYERSFPYHTYLLDETQKLLRERMRLPALETMHLTHVMLQVARGLLAGRGRHRGVAWTQHLLGKDQGPNGVHFFTRVEFQDGSKKPGTQQYHGSGRPTYTVCSGFATLALLTWRPWLLQPKTCRQRRKTWQHLCAARSAMLPARVVGRSGTKTQPSMLWTVNYGCTTQTTTLPTACGDTFLTF